VNRAILAIVPALAAGGCNAGSAAPDSRQRQTAPGAPAPSKSPAAPGAQPPSSWQAPRDAGGVDADIRGLAGKPLYLALCAPCHAADGTGYAADNAPSLVNPTFLESATDEFLRRSIILGRPGTSMAGYGRVLGGPLDDAGVDRLVAFLREQGPAARPLAPTRPGDVALGAAIYARQCASCHGDGKTRGEATMLANPQFQAAASDAFVRHAIVHGRPGTKMEAFAGKLDDAEIDGVVSYVRTLGRGAPAVSLLPEPGAEPVVVHPSGKQPSFKLRAAPCPPAAPGPAARCTPDPRFVSVDDVAKAFAAKQRMVLIDARPPSDWRRVHIAGAVSIPYHDMKRLDEVPRDGTWAIAYCACPHHLSGIVVDELRRRGYRNVAVLDEGINEWQRRGYPVVAAEGVSVPPAERPARPAAPSVERAGQPPAAPAAPPAGAPARRRAAPPPGAIR
jgi:cytochrome c oxidase cbb3-type subunit III